MARDNDSPRSGSTRRDKYRDNDDTREPLEDDARTGGSADTKSEARGDARDKKRRHG